MSNYKIFRQFFIKSRSGSVNTGNDFAHWILHKLSFNISVPPCIRFRNTDPSGGGGGHTVSSFGNLCMYGTDLATPLLVVHVREPQSRHSQAAPHNLCTHTWKQQKILERSVFRIRDVSIRIRIRTNGLRIRILHFFDAAWEPLLQIGDPGYGAFLTPGSGIRCLFDPWIWDPGWVKSQDPDDISKSSENFVLG